MFLLLVGYEAITLSGHDLDEVVGLGVVEHDPVEREALSKVLVILEVTGRIKVRVMPSAIQDGELPEGRRLVRHDQERPRVEGCLAPKALPDAL